VKMVSAHTIGFLFITGKKKWKGPVNVESKSKKVNRTSQTRLWES